MDLNLFETDAGKTKDGVWIDVDETTRIKVARYGNPKFKKALEREMKPYKRLIDKGAIAEEKADEILVKAISETVLVGWENMTKDGEPLPYTREAATEILLNPKLKDFREFVVDMSQEMQLFKEEEVEEHSEN